MVDIYDDGDYRKTGLEVKRSNVLLVRKPTGRVKPSTYNLPPDGFTYGKRDQFDDEGVREVVGSWQSHMLAPSPRPGRDFVRLNKSAVVNGATNSHDITQYRSTHDIRLKQQQGGYEEDVDHHQVLSSSSSSSSNHHNNININKSSNNRSNKNRGGRRSTSSSTSTSTSTSSMNEVCLSSMTFGKPSRSPTPIHDVICNAYQRQFIIEQRIAQEKRERQLLAMKANKLKGSSMHTRASLGHMKVQAPPPKPMFKMAKFAHIGARIAMPRSAPSLSNPRSASTSSTTDEYTPSLSSFSSGNLSSMESVPAAYSNAYSSQVLPPPPPPLLLHHPQSVNEYQSQAYVQAHQ